jgi:hypothetical protein
MIDSRVQCSCHYFMTQFYVVVVLSVADDAPWHMNRVLDLRHHRIKPHNTTPLFMLLMILDYSATYSVIFSFFIVLSEPYGIGRQVAERRMVNVEATRVRTYITSRSVKHHRQ